MGAQNKKSDRLELTIVPAVLEQNREKFLKNIEKVKCFVKEVHIDVMDNKFVPNETVKPQDVKLPKGVNYQFHWMVENPQEWIEKNPGDYLHQVHVETIKNWELIKRVVQKSGGRLCVALNPATDIEKIFEYAKDVENIMVMCVIPGFSGQRYIKDMEKKIKKLRENYPEVDIEVDGGIDFETIKGASKAGANKFVSNSTIFKHPDIKEAIEKLKKNAFKVRGLNYVNGEDK